MDWRRHEAPFNKAPADIKDALFNFRQCRRFKA